MGIVLFFPNVSELWPSDRLGLRKPDGPWRAIDLKGRRPAWHRKPAYDPRGEIRLEAGQTWVERYTQKLYVIEELNGPTYYYEVVLAAYKREHLRHSLPEESFRYQFRVWDDFERDRRECRDAIREHATNDPESPWKGLEDGCQRAFNFFGFDPDGYRID